MSGLIVTGGGAGIGRAVVEEAGRRGMRVAALDLLAGPACAAAAAALSAGAPDAVGLACDVRDAEDVERAFAQAVARLGALDALVCSAGIDRGGLVHELPEELWSDVIETNLGGTFRACKQALQLFLAGSTGGSIVCIGSPAGVTAFPAAAAYSASKGGVAALVRALAIDYAALGVRVNAVLPGPTDTALMWANVADADRERMQRLIEREIPVKRLATAHEVALAALWLCSPEAVYITGSMLACDGGVLAKSSVSF